MSLSCGNTNSLLMKRLPFLKNKYLLFIRFFGKNLPLFLKNKIDFSCLIFLPDTLRHAQQLILQPCCDLIKVTRIKHLMHICVIRWLIRLIVMPNSNHSIGESQRSYRSGLLCLFSRTSSRFTISNRRTFSFCSCSW